MTNQRPLAAILLLITDNVNTHYPIHIVIT